MAYSYIGTSLDKLVSDYEFQNHQHVKLIEYEDYLVVVLEDEITNTEAEIKRLEQACTELDYNTRQCQKQFSINKDNIESLKKTNQVLNEHVDAMTTKRDLTLSKIKQERDGNDEYLKEYEATWQKYKQVYESMPLAHELKHQKSINEGIRKNIQEKEVFIKASRLKIQQVKGGSNLYKLTTTEFIVKLAKMRLEILSRAQEEDKLKKEITKIQEAAEYQSTCDSDNQLNVAQLSDMKLQDSDSIEDEPSAMEESASSMNEQSLDTTETRELGSVLSSNSVREPQNTRYQSEEVKKIQVVGWIQAGVSKPDTSEPSLTARPLLQPFSVRHPAPVLHPAPGQQPFRVQGGPQVRLHASVKIPALRSPASVQLTPPTQHSPSVQFPTLLTHRPVPVQQPVPSKRPVSTHRQVPTLSPAAVQLPVTMRCPVPVQQPALKKPAPPSVSQGHEKTPTLLMPAQKQQCFLQHFRKTDFAPPPEKNETVLVSSPSEQHKQSSPNQVNPSSLSETVATESPTDTSDTIPTVHSVSSAKVEVGKKVLHPDGCVTFFLPMKGSPSKENEQNKDSCSQETIKSPIDLQKHRKILENLMSKSPGVPDNYLAPLKRPFTEVDGSHQKNENASIPLFGMSPASGVKILNAGDSDSTLGGRSTDTSHNKQEQGTEPNRKYEESAFSLFPSFSDNEDMQQTKSLGSMLNFCSMVDGPKGDNGVNFSAFNQPDENNDRFCFSFDNNNQKSGNHEPTSFGSMFNFGSMSNSPQRDSPFKFPVFDKKNDSDNTDGRNFSFNFGQNSKDGKEDNNVEESNNVMSLFGYEATQGNDDQRFSIDFGTSNFKSPTKSFSLFK